MRRAAAVVLLLLVTLAGCFENRTRTTQMYPDCDQVSAEEQRQGRCMIRPNLPEGF
jgi:ABC-type uncharacterized transport system auxiliary subunit